MAAADPGRCFSIIEQLRLGNMAYWLSAVTVIVSILLPVLLAVALRRRYRVPWIFFSVGVLTFLGAQVVHLPLNELLAAIGLLPEDAPQGAALLQAAVIAGLTAGLTEELARAAGFWLIGRARRLPDGIMMGLGHGGVEAMIFGGVLMAASMAGLWFVDRGGAQAAALPAGDLALVQEQVVAMAAAPALALAPLLERALAVLLHVSLSAIVLQAFVRRQWWYLAVAIAYHTLVNAALAYVAGQVENAWLVEGLFALLVLPGLLYVWRLGRAAGKDRHRPAATFRDGLALFGVALRKELWQQWRTKRVLVVAAVFAVFGMVSPLLARFTPELLSSLEGAEMFADLIPEPTMNDAIGQYVKNLTQFGFLLAIILGMGAVVTEKEKGTAAMILSKPLPRWAFISGKFVAQAALYLLAFAIASIGAYYYTLFLFEAPELGPFLALNGLLWLWLLTFVAVTLLASTVGRSTGAAAGLAAVGAVVLLLAGSLPRFGGLAPAGLVNWGTGLALGAAAFPNAGALTAGLVIILLCLVAAVGAFAEQEL
jgi:ABC-2 type transport system permease protein